MIMIIINSMDHFFSFTVPFTRVNLDLFFLGKLVTIRGTVVRVGNVKPMATHLAFICSACRTQQVGFFKATLF